MGFGESISTCLSKYVTFSGRAVRSEYWWFFLFGIIATFVAAIIDGMFFSANLDAAESGIVGSVTSLALFLPSISANVRRLHDRDKSGWWWWLWLIPIVGWIVQLVWLCQRGTHGPNRFGQDPFGGVDAEIFA